MRFKKHIFELLFGEVLKHSSDVLFPDRIEYDTRRILIPSKTLFLAIDGERKGSSFLNSAYSMGVRNFIVSNDSPISSEIIENSRVLIVPDVLSFLLNKAAEYRSNYRGKVIAITGSRGKTIVKEWLSLSLTNIGKSVSRSPRSYNSKLGLALSLFSMDLSNDFWITEVGISSSGEMKDRAKALNPNLGLITCITSEHESGFSSLEAKLQEKLSLFESLDGFVDGTIKRSEDWRLHNKSLINELLSELNYDHTNILFPELSTRWLVKKGIRFGELLIDQLGSESASLEVALGVLKSRSNRSKLVVLGPLENQDCINEIVEDLPQIEFHLIHWSKELKLPNVVNYENESEFINADVNVDHRDILIKGDLKGLNKVIRFLDSSIHKAYIEIDFDSIRHNVKLIRTKIFGAKLMAMVKAESYGGGSQEVSMFLQEEGVDAFGVAFLPEAIALRKRGITKPILVMNMDSDFDLAVQYDLSVAVYDFRQFDAIKASDLKDDIKIHLKLDTGMHRLGFNDDDLEHISHRISGLPIQVEGVMTHLRATDMEKDGEYSNLQLKRFNLWNKWPQAISHALNTAGILHLPESLKCFDMHRAGIGLYGYDPAGKEKGLRAAFNVVAKVIQTKKIKKGQYVGYGVTPVDKDMRIAIINIGYADGISRKLGNGNWQIQGCPTVGNICMDFLFIDITGKSVNTGEDISLFDQNNGVEQMANKLGTIAYEVMTSFSGRLGNRYIQE